MATNPLYTGNTVPVTLTGNATSGLPLLTGAGLFGVPLSSGVSGDTIALAIGGNWDLAKDASAPAQGAILYWDDSAKKITTTSTGNVKVGCALAAALTGAATVAVQLDGTAAEAATEAAAGAAVAAAVTDTGTVGNAGKLVKLDGSGLLDGYDINVAGLKLAGIAANAAAVTAVAPLAIGAQALGVETTAARGDHVHAHGNQLGGTLHADAVAGVSAGFMSAADATTLANLNTAMGGIKFGTVAVTSGQSAGTAAMGAATWDGASVVVTLQSAAGALHATTLPQVKAVIAAGTLTVTLIDKDGAGQAAASNLVFSYVTIA